MIRILILLLAVFIIWTLFFSDFSKQRKVIISCLAVVIAVFGLWFDQSGQTPKEGLIAYSEIEVYALSAKHSYRSNYDFTFCLKNNSQAATVKRLTIKIIAQDCQQGECNQLEAVSKDFAISIGAGEQIEHTENSQFDALDPSSKDIEWKIEVSEIKALKN